NSREPTVGFDWTRSLERVSSYRAPKDLRVRPNRGSRTLPSGTPGQSGTIRDSPGRPLYCRHHPAPDDPGRRRVTYWKHLSARGRLCGVRERPGDHCASVPDGATVADVL